MNFNWDKLIVALDLDTRKDIDKVIKSLSGKGVKFKIGSIAFTKFGPEFVRKLTAKKIDIFLDLKLYDIPNTMKETAGIITEMGCWAFTVHTKAGFEALSAVKEEVVSRSIGKKIRKPLILGVTELTSSAAKVEQVLALAKVAQAAGLDAVVASSRETPAIKKAFGSALKIITPGIRGPGDCAGDQKRITSALTAFKNGADYIVVGRPIISKSNYLQAAKKVLSY